METAGDENRVLDGNSKSSSTRDVQRLYWFFTWNNYGSVEMGDELERKLKNECYKYVFQEEIGERTGTPHLQGCFELKSRRRLSELKTLLNSKIHFEPTRNREFSIDYCQKIDTKKPNGKLWRSKNFMTKNEIAEARQQRKKGLKVISTLYKWQKQVVDWLFEDPDDRSIFWIFNRNGNVGKTQITKYLSTIYKVVVATGGACKDLAFMLKNAEDNGLDLNDKFTFILNVAKETKMSNISYKALEGIKDGLLTSVKYESGTMMFNSPHVIVFANDAPIVTNLSKDRWKIYEIIDNDLIEYKEECLIKDIE